MARISIALVVVVAVCVSAQHDQHQHQNQDKLKDAHSSHKAGHEQQAKPALLVHRSRRQISYPPLPNAQETPQIPFVAPQAAPPPQAPQLTQQSSSSSVFSFLQDLGPQVERAKALTTLFGGSSPSSNYGSQQAQPAQSSGALPSAADLMSQLSSLIRSTQERSAKMVDDAQQSAQQAGTQTSQAAQNAQGGIQAALKEIGAGLQRLASNNPNLLPDVKSLYQSVSSRLTSASNSVAAAATPTSSGITPAKNGEQLADNLAHVIAQGGN